MSADGSTLAVAGDEGVALLSANGAGLIRRALPRSPDHIYYVAGRDASWVGTASPHSIVPPEEMAAVRSAGRLWRCPAAVRRVPSSTNRLDPTMELKVEPDRDALVVFTNESLTTVVDPDLRWCDDEARPACSDGPAIRRHSTVVDPITAGR